MSGTRARAAAAALAVLVGACADASGRGAVTYSIEQLQNVRAPLLGAVLNDIDV